MLVPYKTKLFCFFWLVGFGFETVLHSVQCGKLTHFKSSDAVDRHNATVDPFDPGTFNNNPSGLIRSSFNHHPIYSRFD